MKKYVLIFAAAFMLCTGAMAQKIDQSAIKAEIEKCDLNVEHPKKGLKASTWLARGKAYADAIVKPTEALFVGQEITIMQLTCGKESATGTETVNGLEYTTYTYPYFVIYSVNGKIATWKESKEIYPGALDLAIESYSKAVELDSESAAAAKTGIDRLINYYKQLGNISLDLNNLLLGSDSFLTVIRLQELPYSGVEAEVVLQYYAGYMLVIKGESDPSYYPKAESILNDAVANGYSEYEDSSDSVDDAERGSVYYYLYSAAYAQRESNPAKLQDAKAYLETGFEKYPKNEKIFEGLMQLYTNEEGMGDPKDLLPAVDATIAADGENFNAWFSRGRIYYAMKDYDECIKSFEKVISIDPSVFEGNFYMGLFVMLKGDAFGETINSTSYPDQSQYNDDLVKLNEIYAGAIPYFEAAHEIKPTDEDTLLYLKQLCFRLRDMPGIMEKYTKYNGLLNAL